MTLCIMLLLCQEGDVQTAGEELSAIIQRLADENIEVRQEAERDLLRQGRPVLTLLQELFPQQIDPEIRARLADIIERLKPTPEEYWKAGRTHAALELLAKSEGVHNPKEYVQKRIQKIVGQLKKDWDPDPSFRGQWFAPSMPKFATELGFHWMWVLTALVELVCDMDPYLPGHRAAYLVIDMVPESTPLLLMKLEGANAHLKIRLCNLLEYMHDSRALPVLKRLATSSDEPKEVRQMARKAYNRTNRRNPLP